MVKHWRCCVGRGDRGSSFYSPFCFPAFIYLETLLNKKAKKVISRKYSFTEETKRNPFTGRPGKMSEQNFFRSRDKSVTGVPPLTGSPGCTRERHPSLAAELLETTTSDLLPRHEVGSLKKTNKKAKKRPLGLSRAPLGTTEEGERKPSCDY